MGESDECVDSVVDGLESLGLEPLAGEVTVIVGDGQRTFKCERELLSRGCGYFKVQGGPSGSSKPPVERLGTTRWVTL